MATGTSLKPILSAIFANSVIALAKGIGFLFSGSSALLSETIHSIADVMNQSLLLLGVKRGHKGESEFFHYGHSQERFFWNLISAMGIFVLGCGVTLYHGFHDLFTERVHTAGKTEQWIIPLILLVSFLFESYSFYVVILEIKKEAQIRKKAFFAYLKESMDPSISAIFWEDAAALTGILLAFLGIVLTNSTGNTNFDAFASILIGLLMGLIAYYLALENKRFLIDRSIPEFEMQQILSVIQSFESVASVEEIKTVVLGPDRLKFSGKIIFSAEHFHSIKKKKTSPKQKTPSEFEWVYSQIQVELAKIENRLQKAIPALRHIELRI